ncbi:type II toxin-antitoxin system PemK/MazF family toxin [Nocardia sp. CDC160]|uniref:type II toxin-antitoxin system PemK/MazF family toxin n=1 Tax=Nocardia sp. CDC160 TaxID=3112166 RepID=UPI002DBA4207|nr:type II toxin-antitoxin system PemK/MazF family toxin [Nocardia sp. CDC160]MEC3913477.1 type II toxin-antitoxin system PemK/MazF family toxin [Nocardia sp. CDC160]
MSYIRGAVHRIDLGNGRGHEQGGRRYGVVLSVTEWSMVTVVPTSTSAQPSPFRPEIEIGGTPTRLLVDQMRALDVAYMKPEMVDFLTAADLTKLETAIRRYLRL